MRQRVPDGEALRRRDLPLIRVGLCLACVAAASAAACGGLDPIVSPDGGEPDATLDAIAAPDTSRDVAPGDAASDADGATDAAPDAAPDADAGAPFACGNKICDSTLHYCEKKSGDGGLADAGLKDGGVEVDTCIPYPASCTDDGGNPSCSCITGQCVCTQVGAEITVTCP